MKARVLLTVLLLLVTPGLRAQDAPEPDVEKPEEKLVLCWYMVCFGASVEVYKQEIELAQRHGIDGFILDCGQWLQKKGDELRPTNYVTSAERLYEAARQLDTGFRLAMCPEYSVQPFAPNVKDMVRRFHDHPNQLRRRGQVVLSGYCAPRMFQAPVEQLSAEGIEVELITHAFLPRHVYNPSASIYEDLLSDHPYVDGLMMFNADQLGNVIGKNAASRRACQRLGKLHAAGVIPAYNSANLQDYRGLSGYLAMWEGAINDGSDWISVVIWNDYNEDSALMPMRWPAGSERHLYSRDESFLFATAYASAWFKSGRRPAITQDRLFVTYRNRSKWLRRAWNGKEWVDVTLTSGRFDQIHDDVADRVYVDSFLTAPARLTVRLDRDKERFDLPAGVGHVSVPMQPGVPRLILERDGDELADVLGRREIIDTPTKRNSLLSYHHLNRTWASGTAIGPVRQRLEAEDGTLTGDAELDRDGRTRGVRTSETLDSGFRVPVRDLPTGTYNVRIVYRNTAEEDARLTLFADGPPRAEKDFPYFIPAFLPPTGDDFATVSFLWSLYDTTTELRLQYQDSKMWGKPKPEDDDYGAVMVDAIELVAVEPIARPEPRDPLRPDLVMIPGGRFEMGSKDGEPDELPRRRVTISPFYMARHEVTNAQFERFDPEHRKVRDGNSWRDREPVVHVSWLDAARYCNWLSEQHGLQPAYQEVKADPDKPGAATWATILSAEGFRLPTEAEWEFVATGRGEGRRYPWGDDEPIPGHHGRFQLAAGLGARLPRPATEDQGTVVVGSFAAGASRDGVRDLAGNVAEWCSDWYAPYPEDDQTDPCQQTPGNYRVIRGGSWGWYGHSQRSTDREFNSERYPGHAYYGFRVVISARGYQKLQSRAE